MLNQPITSPPLSTTQIGRREGSCSSNHGNLCSTETGSVSADTTLLGMVELYISTMAGRSARDGVAYLQRDGPL